MFEKEGRGVFLPYEKFQALWNAARQQTKGTEPPKRPVDALINAIESEATIADQVVNVSATLQLEILGEGLGEDPAAAAPIRHPLGPDQRSAGTAGLRPDTGHQLLYQKQGDQPLQLELKLEYTRAFTKTPGQSSVSFEAPQAPINRWTRPRAGSGHGGADRADDCRHARPGRRGRQRYSNKPTCWRSSVPHPRSGSPGTRKPKGPAGWRLLPRCRSNSRFTISEGVARSTHQIGLRHFARQRLSQLLIEVPADQKVVNVFDRNVKRWNVEEQDGKQVIRVELFEATQGKQPLLVELEKFSDATQSTYDVSAALVRAVGVGRQQGIVVARLEEGSAGRSDPSAPGCCNWTRTICRRVCVNPTWEFAYRYGAVPYELDLRVEKVLPRISVTELVDAELTSDRLTLELAGTLSDQGCRTVPVARGDSGRI